MDALKDIPGYKAILKAVIKSQIQHLAEQLATHTDEESIILTASVADGTLTHFGSSSGRSFLTDHDEVKTQFMGFCVKKHNASLQSTAIEQQLKASTVSNLPNILPKPAQHKVQHTIIPISLASIVPLSQSKSPGVRHEPYPQTRRGRKTSLNFEAAKTSVIISDGQNIPAEYSDMREESAGLDDVQPLSPVHDQLASITTSTPLKQDTDLNDGSNSGAVTEEDAVDVMDGVQVKLENMKEEDPDLDCSGSGDVNDCDGSAETSTDSTTNNQSDYQHEVSTVGVGDQPVKVHVCNHCGKPFPSKWELSRHRRIHTGEKPYKCTFCSKAFSDKSNMTQHVRGVHFKQPYRRDRDPSRADRESPDSK